MAERGLRRTRVGVVVSDKMNRTVVVEVRRTVQHRFYLKFIQKRSKFLAHDHRVSIGIVVASVVCPGVK